MISDEEKSQQIKIEPNAPTSRFSKTMFSKKNPRFEKKR